MNALGSQYLACLDQAITTHQSLRDSRDTPMKNLVYRCLASTFKECRDAGAEPEAVAMLTTRGVIPARKGHL